MSTTYFDKFNIISYSNNAVVDITERVVIANNLIRNPYVYYPQDIRNGIRPDQLAFSAYNDPYTSWMIYISNQIVDPYYEWYLNDSEFTNYIKSKYGSLAAATNKVMYYRNNWVDQPSISVTTYNSLTPNQQIYWQPKYGVNSVIINYFRKQKDWTSSTNFTINLSVEAAANSYVNNEIVTLSSGANAQVVLSTNGTLTIQHVNGTVGTGYVYGTESGTNSVVTEVTYIANNIPSDVISYWEPVYYYDYEVEKNEGNKFVNVLNPSFVNDLNKSVKNLLSE
jgi:Base plate wedge protein 53